MAEEKEGSSFDPIGALAGWLARLGTHKSKAHDHFDTFIEWVGAWGMSRGAFLAILYTVLVVAASELLPGFITLATGWMFATAPVWIPITFIWGLTRVWLWYVNSRFLSTRRGVLLEIRLPREITKSPRAMEVALTSLYVTSGETTFIDRWWDGKLRTVFSLELVSFGGETHFYIWCWKEYRNVIEAQLYAQFPEIEIVEAEDYASKFVYKPDEYEVWGSDYRWDKKDRNDAYPIKTYIDYELDKDPKEEFKVDPLAQVLEVFSSLKGSEMAWMQILIRANKDSETDFRKLVKDQVEHIRSLASIQPSGEHPEPGEEARRGFPHPTWQQTEQIRAMERNAGKRTFTVGIRTAYIAKHEEFDGNTRTAIRWIFQPFLSEYLNSLRPARWHNNFDYPWQDFRNYRWRLHSRRFFDAWRRRSYFYTPWISPYLIMSTEELATLYHFPSSTIQSPGLLRIPSTKAEPPPNLPL